MNKILVTGATGLLGSSLVPHLRNKGYAVVAHARNSQADTSFDLSNRRLTFNQLTELQPTVIINLVGLTSVELCEEQVNLAYRANTSTVENLAYWMQVSGANCHLIQISTDHVYDGVGPHRENAITLTNYYAFSKYAGELAARCVPSTVLRTNFVGKSKVSNRESLTDWVYSSITKQRQVQVLNDVYFSPLSISVLVQMIQLVVELRPLGVYNLGSRDGMSKADFDFAFAECLNLPTDSMMRIETSEAKFLKAYRPRDMRMDCSKFEDMMKIQLPSLSELIEQMAKEYDETS